MKQDKLWQRELCIAVVKTRDYMQHWKRALQTNPLKRLNRRLIINPACIHPDTIYDLAEARGAIFSL